MLGKTASIIMLSLLVTSALALAYNIQPVRASGTVYIRADGSIDPSTAPIQRNGDMYTLTGNITSDADGIVIERDNIVLNGAGYTVQGTGSGTGITLSGRTNVTTRNTMIKAFNVGIWVGTSSNYNSMSGNNITANHEYGISLGSSLNNSISGNNIASNDDGIWLDSSSNNSISGNNITANTHWGIALGSSLSDVLRSNILNNNAYGLLVVGSSLSQFVHDIDISNMVNGKPVYYWVNEAGRVVPADAGYVALVNCTGITVQNLTLSRNAGGILLAYTTNTTITRNNITNNECGIVLYSSSNNSISGNNVTANNNDGISLGSSLNNSISGNTITNNGLGIYLASSSNNSISGNNVTANNYCGICLSSSDNNTVFHNNLINNATQAILYGSCNSIWDDGYPSGGNYWNDYIGVDVKSGPYQNITGSDEIGDTPYIIDENNRDNYPIMKTYPWAAHDVGITSVTTSKNVVGQGYIASINVMMFNYGNDTETASITIYVNQTIIGEIYNIDITSRNFTIIPFIWNTTGFAKGNYTISAYAEPVPGETSTADNNSTDGWVVVSMVGDLTGGSENPWDFVPDGVVDGSDLSIVAKCYGSWPEAQPPMIWNANCDVNNDGVVDGSDLAIIAKHFGEADP